MSTQSIPVGHPQEAWPDVAGARDVFVARQPILDVDQQVYAYELLFRDGLNDVCCEGADPTSATKQVVYNMFMTLGVDRLLSGRPAFVNVTTEDLLSGWVHTLSSDSAVIELLETIEVTDAVVEACCRLKDEGFRIGLDDFVYRKQWDPLIELADIVKVSFRDTPSQERRRPACLVAEQTAHHPPPLPQQQKHLRSTFQGRWPHRRKLRKPRKLYML